jgi:ketosteroid isomerase-like protein
MRTRLFQIMAVVAALGLASCGGKPPTQEFGKADVDQIKKMLQDFVVAYNAKDVAKVGSHFSQTATLMPANRSTLRGMDLVKGYYDELFKDGATDLTLQPGAVEGQGSLGFIAATFSLNMRPSGSAVPVHDRGKMLMIVRKLGGQWRFDYQSMSSDLPPVVSEE